MDIVDKVTRQWLDEKRKKREFAKQVVKDPKALRQLIATFTSKNIRLIKAMAGLKEIDSRLALQLIFTCINYGKAKELIEDFKTNDLLEYLADCLRKCYEIYVRKNLIK